MCTDFLIATGDPNVVVAGRTFEYADYAPPAGETAVEKAGYQIAYHAKGHTETYPEFGGDTWKNAYNFVTLTVNAAPPSIVSKPLPPFAVEGMNDGGFSVSALWFSSVKYKDHKEKNWKNVATFLPYLLGTHNRVEAVLEEVRSGDLAVYTFEEATPLHWILHDSTGASGVIEFTKKETTAVSNTSHVCTNQPDFAWHIYNLGFYANLSIQSPQIEVCGYKLPMDGGYGVRGIPGDNLTASRFVRTFYLKKFAMEHSPPKTGPEAMNLAFRLMDSVVVVKGVVPKDEFAGTLPGETSKDKLYAYTVWICAKDLAKSVFVYRTYASAGLQSVKLHDVNWAEMHGKSEDVRDVPYPI